MKRYCPLIERNPAHHSALVTILEYEIVNGNVENRKIVAEYETSSAGATRSARRHIRKLEKAAK